MKNRFFFLIAIFIFNSCNRDLRLGKRSMEEGDYSTSIEYFNKVLERDSNNQNALVLRASCYIRSDKLTNARRDLEKAIKLDPNDLDSYINLGHVCYVSQDSRSAKGLFHYVYSKNDEYENVNFNLGVIYFDETNYDSALFFFSKELILQPSDHEAYIYKGHTLQMLDRLEEAKHEMYKALSLYEDPQAYFILGIIHFNQERYSLALLFHNKAIALDSTNLEFYIKRSATYLMLNNLESALTDCNKVLSIDKLNLDAYIVRKEIYRRLQQKNEFLQDSIKIESLKLLQFMPQ